MIDQLVVLKGLPEVNLMLTNTDLNLFGKLLLHFFSCYSHHYSWEVHIVHSGVFAG